MVANVFDVLDTRLLEDTKLLDSELAVNVTVLIDRPSALWRKSEAAIGIGFTKIK